MAALAGDAPFRVHPDGRGWLYVPYGLQDGPLPVFYEPFETPLEKNPLSPKALSNPAARVFKDDLARMGKPQEFPFVATSYRLTEHFHFWTKHAAIPSILQPEQFVEIGEALAQLRGIKNGDLIVVKSKRNEIRVKALVTKRIGPLIIEGKEIHTVGIPIHWGFRGLTKPGYLINALTPFVGDANVQTPEFKAFLVDVRKA